MTSTINTNYRTDPSASMMPLPKFNAEHAFLRKFGSVPNFGAYHAPKPLLETISKVCAIVMKALVFLIFPKIFIVGFICGIVWDESCYAAIQRIKAVWDHQSIGGKALMFACGFIGAPAVILSASFLIAASIGAQCHQALPLD